MIVVQIDASDLTKKLDAVAAAVEVSGLLKAISLSLYEWHDEHFETEGHGEWPPWSENTAAVRGGGRMLQDTGRLRASFVSKIEKNVLAFGSPLELAAYHHYGTPPYEIRPVTAKALHFMTADGEVFAKHVNHPGLPPRRLLPTEKEAEEMAVKLIEARLREVASG